MGGPGRGRTKSVRSGRPPRDRRAGDSAARSARKGVMRADGGGEDPMPKIPQSAAVEEYRFADDGHIPNNPRLPLLVYRGVLETGADAALSCAALFARHGWTGAWRNGIHAYHHYHSTAHEVLGLGAGDVVVIPAGVAHKCEAASPDLLVVGAYPRGQVPDSRQAGARERERALPRIAAVALPQADPVHGGKGPLIERWRPAPSAW